MHFHGAEDGSRPLGASLPLEALLPACQPSAAAATLLAAAEARCSHLLYTATPVCKSLLVICMLSAVRRRRNPASCRGGQVQGNLRLQQRPLQLRCCQPPGASEASCPCTQVGISCYRAARSCI